MADSSKDWSHVTLEPQAELIVGWRPRRSRLDAEAVELSREVSQEIGAMCVATLERLSGLVPRPYGGSPYIEPGEEYLSVPAIELPRADSQSQGEDDDEAAGLSDLQRLVGTAGLPSLSRDDLRGGKYPFYAAICTERGRSQRVGFVRQTNPHRVARTGGLTTVLGREGLQRLEDPVFVLDATFDLVVTPKEVAVLRLEAFNRMFADLNTISEAAPANAALIAKTVPDMTPSAVQALAAAGAQRPSVARRLQRLLRPNVLPQVTSKALASALKKHGLDPDRVVVGETIEFDPENAMVFLDLLEQLYYETDFTGEHRRADRYSPLH